MTDFEIRLLPDASVLALDDMRDLIHINPDYQRPGGVWNIKIKQLFIDSLLNGYDIPKIYFHQIQGSEESPSHKYAIIDGRQRLETIWAFVDGKFPLASGFEYIDNMEVNAGEMTYRQLSEEYPKLVTRLNSRALTIVVVSADDLDIVEDMFSRLNEAVPLNAAEKRNSFGGPLPPITRRLVRNEFFTRRLNISDNRYRHHDIAAKFLYLESNEDIVDTKKASLDSFFQEARERGKEEGEEFRGFEDIVYVNLEKMNAIFVENDSLLRSSGMVVVYYALVSQLGRDGTDVYFGRANLVQFEELRACNRTKFENDLEGVDRRLIEFDELARSSNDGAAIRERLEILRRNLDS